MKLIVVAALIFLLFVSGCNRSESLYKTELLTSENEIRCRDDCVNYCWEWNVGRGWFMKTGRGDYKVYYDEDVNVCLCECYW